MGVKGYKIWRPEVQKVRVSNKLTFDEVSMVKQCQKEYLYNMGKEIIIPQLVEFEGVKYLVETTPIALDGSHHTTSGMR